jgi:hypothetical protein
VQGELDVLREQHLLRAEEERQEEALVQRFNEGEVRKERRQKRWDAQIQEELSREDSMRERDRLINEEREAWYTERKSVFESDRATRLEGARRKWATEEQHAANANVARRDAQRKARSKQELLRDTEATIEREKLDKELARQDSAAARDHGLVSRRVGTKSSLATLNEIHPTIDHAGGIRKSKGSAQQQMDEQRRRREREEVVWASEDGLALVATVRARRIGYALQCLREATARCDEGDLAEVRPTLLTTIVSCILTVLLFFAGNL